MNRIIFTIKVLIFALVLAVWGVSHAQHCDSIINHQFGQFFMVGEYVTQLGDESILCRAFLDSLVPSSIWMPVKPYGCVYYKISRFGCEFIDSLFVEDNNIEPKLMAHIRSGNNPQPDRSNILVEYLFDTVNCKTDLRFAFFDDDLNFETDEIIVPLADTIVRDCSYYSSFLLDSYDDIVVAYSIESRHVSCFARFGIDGTLKYEKVYPDTIVPVPDEEHFGWAPNGLRQTNVSPLKYSFYGEPYVKAFRCFDLDSLFNIENVFYLRRPDYDDYPRMFSPTSHCGMVRLSDGSRVVMQELAERQYEPTKIGVAKYNQEGDLQKTWFSSVVPTTSGQSSNLYAATDLRIDGEEYIYFASTTIPQATGRYLCYLIKMDKDLNIVYERYFRHPQFFFNLYGMNVLDRGGMCVYGEMWDPYSTNSWLSGLFMLVLDDDGVPVSEIEGIIQPFLIYPNPVSDRLNIHYSPDVTPETVELYDVQGRLVHTQNSSLENIGIENLPAGTYTLRVVMEGGENYTEKVVKQ